MAFKLITRAIDIHPVQFLAEPAIMRRARTSSGGRSSAVVGGTRPPVPIAGARVSEKPIGIGTDGLFGTSGERQRPAASATIRRARRLNAEFSISSQCVSPRRWTAISIPAGGSAVAFARQ